MPLEDMIFACVFKVYSTFSLRRFNTDLSEAKQKDFISSNPNHASIARYFSMEMLTPYLKKYTAITIISMKNEEIKEAITDRLHRGVTVYRGSGGIGSKGESDSERDILYCVVTRLEIGNIKNVIKDIDPSAFVTTHTLTEVDGGLIKKSGLH